MRRAQRGDADAFEALYDRHAERALRVALATTRDRGLAADAVQEGFLAIWRKRASYSPEHGAFTAWAMTVVRNRAIDLMRREGSTGVRGALEPEALAEIADSGLGTAERVWQRAEVRRVREGLDELPVAQRDAIVMAYYGGLSHSEIAAQLSLPLGTVKGRMRLGLEKLQEMLAPAAAQAS